MLGVQILLAFPQRQEAGEARAGQRQQVFNAEEVDAHDPVRAGNGEMDATIASCTPG